MYLLSHWGPCRKAGAYLLSIFERETKAHVLVLRAVRYLTSFWRSHYINLSIILEDEPQFSIRRDECYGKWRAYLPWRWSLLILRLILLPTLLWFKRIMAFHLSCKSKKERALIRPLVLLTHFTRSPSLYNPIFPSSCITALKWLVPKEMYKTKFLSPWRINPNLLLEEKNDSCSRRIDSLSQGRWHRSFCYGSFRAKPIGLALCI